MWQSVMGMGAAGPFAITPAPTAPAEPKKVLRLSPFMFGSIRLGGGVGRRGRQAIAELIRHAYQLAVVECHVQQLLAVHGPAELVLHLANDLARLHVDDVARRDVGQVSIQTNGDPVGTRRRPDALN